MKIKKMITALIFIIMASCSLKNDKLTVISISSLNGNIFPVEKDSVKYGGFSLIATKIKEINGGNSLKTDIIGNSNFIYGTREAYFTTGRSVIELMNFLDFSCLVIGHREFYFGFDELENLSKIAEFPFVSANLVFKDSTRIDFIKPYVILKDGKCAVIGISTEKVVKANLEKDVKAITILDPAEAVKKYVSELNEKGINNIIVAGDYDCGESSGSNLTSSQADRLFSAEKVKIFLTTAESNTSCSLEGKKPIHSCGINGSEIVSFKISSNSMSDVKHNFINSKIVKPDQDISSKMSDISNMMESITGKILGTASEDIWHSESDKFTSETPLGDLITDIMREFTGTEIFLMNSGKVRKGFEKGPVTLGDLYNIIPYEGNLVSVNMTGEQIAAVLESSCSFKMNKSFLQVSGISFTFNSSKKPGERVIMGSIQINGKLLDKKRVYSVSLTDYIFQGGDSYSEFREMGLELRETYQKQMREIIKDFISSRGSISKGINNRITDVSKL